MASRFNSRDLVPTEELAGRALELLRAGEIAGEFANTAQHLTLSTGEPQAVMEGSLLLIGADLEKIAQAGCDPDKDPAVEHLQRDRRLFLYLEFVEGFFETNTTRQLRPIGKEILSHCMILSSDTEITAALNRIKDTSSQTQN